ncbi:MAG: hypothetical protein ACKVUS_04030 [Saprospiraceae bacterium]
MQNFTLLCPRCLAAKLSTLLCATMLSAQTYLYSETSLTPANLTTAQSERYAKLSNENFSSIHFVQVGSLSSVQQNAGDI